MHIIICSPSPSRPYAIWRPAARVTMQIAVSLSPFADVRGEQPVHLHQDGRFYSLCSARDYAKRADVMLTRQLASLVHMPQREDHAGWRASMGAR